MLNLAGLVQIAVSPLAEDMKSTNSKLLKELLVPMVLE